MTSIAQTVNQLPFEAHELRLLITSILTDLGVLATPTTAGVTDTTAIRAEVVKLVTDITALRVVVAALVTDMATRITNFNTLTTKLNADAGVTDTNYAAAGAITALAPAAITAANPAAISAVAPAALTTTA